MACGFRYRHVGRCSGGDGLWNFSSDCLYVFSEIRIEVTKLHKKVQKQCWNYKERGEGREQ